MKIKKILGIIGTVLIFIALLLLIAGVAVIGTATF